jgi:aspartate-semialdehyde dehydrogenase
MSERKLNIAVVGATGLVGRNMLKVLNEKNLPVKNLILLASEKSAGTRIEYKGESLPVEVLGDNSFDGIDIALFSAGSEISRKYAPVANENGCIVIDNSSAFRMDKSVPLLVPEVNSYALEGHRGIIANPNCSTIQLVVAIKPIEDKYGIERLVCSTYQSISGAGQKGVDKLQSEIEGESNEKGHKIAYNAIFHPLSESDGFTEEEFKMYNETRKILDKPDMKIAFTCVRLPIIGGHAESVNLELKSDFNLAILKEDLAAAEGIIVMDDMNNDLYPTPLFVNEKNEVYIGRIRRDNSVENGLYLWVVADNLRKGAATNAVQIAEEIIKKELFEF